MSLTIEEKVKKAEEKYLLRSMISSWYLKRLYMLRVRFLVDVFGINAKRKKELKKGFERLKENFAVDEFRVKLVNGMLQRRNWNITLPAYCWVRGGFFREFGRLYINCLRSQFLCFGCTVDMFNVGNNTVIWDVVPMDRYCLKSDRPGRSTECAYEGFTSFLGELIDTFGLEIDTLSTLLLSSAGVGQPNEASFTVRIPGMKLGHHNDTVLYIDMIGKLRTKSILALRDIVADGLNGDGRLLRASLSMHDKPLSEWMARNIMGRIADYDVLCYYMPQPMIDLMALILMQPWTLDNVMIAGSAAAAVMQTGLRGTTCIKPRDLDIHIITNAGDEEVLDKLHYYVKRIIALLANLSDDVIVVSSDVLRPTPHTWLTILDVYVEDGTLTGTKFLIDIALNTVECSPVTLFESVAITKDDTGHIYYRYTVPVQNCLIPTHSGILKRMLSSGNYSLYVDPTDIPDGQRSRVTKSIDRYGPLSEYDGPLAHLHREHVEEWVDLGHSTRAYIPMYSLIGVQTPTAGVKIERAGRYRISWSGFISGHVHTADTPRDYQ